ncbi:hypothetical protein BG000_003925 [Podila horticola]|nr:hypothetical protein BG000_003925 [Podila horticola]
MAARLPPELAGELYCRANVEPMQYATMNPQTATELLDRAWLLYTQSQLSFGYNYIDKPPEGAGFFIKVLGDEMAHDGYQYMDDEISYGNPKDPRMIIKERSQGFKSGDQFTHIIRRKYQLVQPGRETLALLHYSRADDSRAVVVDGRRAKTAPRTYPLKPIPGLGTPTTPQQPQQVQPGGFRPGYPQQPQHPQMKSPPGFNPAKGPAPYGGAPVAGSPASPQQPGYPRFNAGGPPPPGQAPPGQGPHRLSSTTNAAYGNQRHEKKSSHKKHSQQPQLTPQHQAQILAQQQAQAQEDAEEPSGDELDFLTSKDVAIARYKRNHDYVAEVFSPYPTSRIIPTKTDYTESISYLKEQSAKSGDNLENLVTEHDEKIKRFKAEAAVFYKGLDDLKQATTVQEVFAANERVESFMGMTVQPYLFLRQIDLPKEQLAPTPELKPAKIPQSLPVVPDTVMEDVPQSAIEAIPAESTHTPAPLTHENIAEVNAQSGAPAASTLSVATTSMEVDSTIVNPPESLNGMPVSEDTDMTNAENDFMNDMLNSQSAETSHQSTPAPGSIDIVAPSTEAPEIQTPAVDEIMTSVVESTPVVETTPIVEESTLIADTPVIENITPVIESTPAIKSSTPVTETITPIIDTNIPIVDANTAIIDNTPIIETSTPVIETSTPTIETSTPTNESTPNVETTPVLETSTPVIESNTLVIESTPMTETITSVIETPVTETITPVIEIATETITPVIETPVTETITPVIETPVAETITPVIESVLITEISTPVLESSTPVADSTPAIETPLTPAEPVAIPVYANVEIVEAIAPVVAETEAAIPIIGEAIPTPPVEVPEPLP